MSENDTRTMPPTVFPTYPRRQLMFSLITGDIYEIEFDEIKNMDRYQIPLIKHPKQSCTACYGRMYSGYNDDLKIYVLCNKCMNNCIDFKLMRGETIDIETIKHD